MSLFLDHRRLFHCCRIASRPRVSIALYTISVVAMSLCRPYKNESCICRKFVRSEIKFWVVSIAAKPSDINPGMRDELH